MAEPSTSPTPTAPPRKRKRSGRLGAYQDKKGVWVIDLVYKGHRIRKRLGRGLSADTVKQIAQRESLALRTSVLLTGRPPGAKPKITDLSIAAACARFEREAFADLRPNTRAFYRRMMPLLRERLGTLTLGGLSALDLERYRRERTQPVPGRRTTARIACNRELALLGAIYRKCQAWKLVSRTDNPFSEVRRYAEPRGRERILSFDEEDRLLRVLHEPARTVVQLGIECGARIQSELLPVRWEDVDLDRAQLHIKAVHSKNGKPRVLPLSERMTARLRGMQEVATSAYVFPARRGGFNHRFKEHFYTAVRRAGFAGTGVNIHCCRHTWASRMLEAGADLVLVRDLGGWADLSLVSRYSHHRPQRAREAVAAMLALREPAARREAPALVVVGSSKPGQPTRG